MGSSLKILKCVKEKVDTFSQIKAMHWFFRVIRLFSTAYETVISITL